MRLSYLTICLLTLITGTSHAVKTVMEGIETSNGTMLVSTSSKRTDFNGPDYAGSIPNVGVYSSSNAVVGNCVLYSTGSLTCPTLVGSLAGGSGSTTNYYLIGSQQDDLSASANGTQTSFSLSQIPGSTSTVRCVLDGLSLVNPKDFTFTLPNTVNVTTAPASNPSNFFCYYNTQISTLPASSIGNMSTISQNLMASGSAVTYGSGSSDNHLAGSTVTYSTTSWTLATGNVSTYTYVSGILQQGGPDNNVFMSTLVFVSTGVCFTNLPSSVPYSMQGIGLTLNFVGITNPWSVRLGTETVSNPTQGDFQSDTMQAGWGFGASGVASDWGMGSGANTYQAGGCILQQSGNSIAAGTDHFNFIVGNETPIYPGLGGNDTIFNYWDSYSVNSGPGLAREDGTCRYNPGHAGPINSPVTTVCLYPPKGAQFSGTVKLLRGAQTPGGN